MESTLTDYKHINDAAFRLLQTWRNGQLSSHEAFDKLHAQLTQVGWNRKGYELTHTKKAVSQATGVTQQDERQWFTKKCISLFIAAILIPIFATVATFCNILPFQLEKQGPQPLPASHPNVLEEASPDGEGSGLTTESKKKTFSCWLC